MIIQYFDVIHCTTQEEVTAVIDKLHEEQGLTWLHDDENPLIENPSEFELQQEFFKKITEEEKEEFYIVTIKLPDLDKCIVQISRKTHNIETMRASLAETDEEESSKDTIFYEASDFLGGIGLFEMFAVDYDVYDTSDNYVRTIKNKKDLATLYNTVAGTGSTYVVYVGSERVEINDSHNIDYYDSKITF